jgi:N-acetylglucosaminyldiphosphoundecaprenol N-acetyl-beta-D-mannosaminyltransferase
VTLQTTSAAPLPLPHAPGWSHPTFHLGTLDVDDLTLAEALDAIVTLVRAGQGGTVLTPNTDHVVLAEHDARLRDAYAGASLSLVDGTPLLWASRLLGPRLREKVSGSDLVFPLMQRAAADGLRVYLLGGAPGVAERAAEQLRDKLPSLRIVGTDAPDVGLEGEALQPKEALARVNAARPDLVLVALGCPKQEIFMRTAAAALRPAVLLGIGASLDFLAGTAHRAPPWVSAAGLEWLYRLGQEPRRLWRRYLVRDPELLAIAAREVVRRARRAKSASPPLPPETRVLLVGDHFPADLEAQLELPGVLWQRRSVLAGTLPPAASITAEPTHIIVALAPDDALRATGQPETALTKARELLAGLAERSPRPSVVVCSIPPPLGDDPRLEQGIVLANRGLRALAEERGLGWIDLHGMLRDDHAPRPCLDPRFADPGEQLSARAYRLLRDAVAAELGQRTPRLVSDAARDAGAVARDALTHARTRASERTLHRGLFARELDPTRDRVALLFFGDVERDTWIRGDRAARRLARQVRHALTHRHRISGFSVAFQALCRALSRAGFRVVVDDYELARANPRFPIGIAGYPHILDDWALPNPAVLGPGLFDHPAQALHLLKDPRIRAYLTPEGWMTALFGGTLGELCMPWHAGIDLEAWPSFRAAQKDIDVLVYAKFLWDRESGRRILLAPLLAELAARGQRVHVIRYGDYEPGEYRVLLRRSRAMVYLCEHETQGIACAEAMACDVPILAWDQGEWLDPVRLRYGDSHVPASSVPYFDPTCGERFQSTADLGPALERFLRALPDYAPRTFVARRLSLDASARLYEAALARAAGLAAMAPWEGAPAWPS